MNTVKNILINLSLAIVSCFIFLLILEGLTRIIFHLPYHSNYAFRRSRPKPYAASDYFSKKFINESLHHGNGLINPKGTRMLIPKDYKGVFYNIVNNYRYTTDQPINYSNTIYLFGGSTIYNAEVPDYYTIASYLQRNINKEQPDKYRVINCGVTSINTMQQLEKLQSTKILAKDIIIFYGGVNDALLFTTGRVNGWIIGENDREYENFNFAQKLKFKIYMKLNEKSDFVTKFLYPFSDSLPQHLKNPDLVKKLQNQLYVSYMNSIQRANIYCKSKDASFYNFVQPNLLTRKPNTDYEKELLKNKYLVSPQSVAAVKLSYIPILQANTDLKNSGINSRDLTSIFNFTTDDYFLDYCHVTEKANSIIAAEIFKSLKN